MPRFNDDGERTLDMHILYTYSVVPTKHKHNRITERRRHLKDLGYDDS